MEEETKSTDTNGTTLTFVNTVANNFKIDTNPTNNVSR